MDKDLKRVLYWHGGFVALLGGYYVVTLAVGLEPREPLKDSLVTALRVGAVLAAVRIVLELARHAVSSRLLHRPGPTLRQRAPRLGLYLIGIPVLAFGFFVMFDTHAAWKVAIPQFVPFGWDPPLARFDALIHLGTDPWRWSHALPLRNALTLGLDGVYMLWYYSVAGTAMVALALLPEDRRARFFVGFLLLWITAGTVAAIALASGGPVYYGYLTGDPDRFAALLDAVDGTFARALQEELWTAFMTERDVAYRGVSAMPSMHVAAILYFAAWGWSLHPALGVLGTAYGLLIFWGSVHLGWHYAVDGYVAAAFALVCWAVVRVKGQRTGQNSVRGAPASSIPPSGSS